MPPWGIFPTLPFLWVPMVTHPGSWAQAPAILSSWNVPSPGLLKPHLQGHCSEKLFLIPSWKCTPLQRLPPGFIRLSLRLPITLLLIPGFCAAAGPMGEQSDPHSPGRRRQPWRCRSTLGHWGHEACYSWALRHVQDLGGDDKGDGAGIGV